MGFDTGNLPDFPGFNCTQILRTVLLRCTSKKDCLLSFLSGRKLKCFAGVFWGLGGRVPNQILKVALKKMELHLFPLLVVTLLSVASLLLFS